MTARTPWAGAPGRVDRLLAAAVAVAAVLMAAAPPDGTGPVATAVGVALAPVLALPALWWRSAPLRAALALPVAVLVSGLPTLDRTRCGVAIPVALLVIFAAGARLPRRPAVAGLLCGLAAMAALLVTDPLLDRGALFIVPLAAGAWLAGRAARAQSALADRLADRTALLEERRARVAALAAEVERARLAGTRDGDGRAGVARILALAAPAGGAPPFAEIEAVGRDALERMRDAVGALRGDARD